MSIVLSSVELDCFWCSAKFSLVYQAVSSTNTCGYWYGLVTGLGRSGWQLELILKAFSNLNDAMILWNTVFKYLCAIVVLVQTQILFWLQVHHWRRSGRHLVLNWIMLINRWEWRKMLFSSHLWRYLEFCILMLGRMRRNTYKMLKAISYK